MRSNVDANGVLNLSVPLGKADANREVRVTVRPMEEVTTPMSAGQWRQFVHELAGSFDDVKINPTIRNWLAPIA